ncbi:stage II sporulation protein R [Thermolongibacillus altinsuensis]
MKKYLVCLYMILCMIGALVAIYGQQTEAQTDVVIPKEAVRLRILANSDAPADQALKRAVRDAVNAQITTWVKDLTSFAEAREVIQKHLPEIKQTVEQVLQQHESDQSYQVKFDHVSFPTKIYGNYVYPAGEYEAVLITLGEGKGANWWCVLFPPLCFLDFSNGEAVRAAELNEDPMNEDLMDEGTMNEEDAMDEDLMDEGAMEEETMEVIDDEPSVEVKFFVVEVLKKIMQ